ncbi:MAG: FAD-dependent oxidoreductase [Armatimonadetes bacterium]|nr:FAD-dependent oxidoreductase [Armatimonadota bacterium]
MKNYDVLIIGGGPAAISACRVFGSSPRKMSVAVIRPEQFSMIYCAMPYAIEGVVTVEQTFKEDTLVTGNGAELIRDAVAEVDFAKNEVATLMGERYHYRKLIIATGANPVVPNLPGADLNGIMTFKTGDDLIRIRNLVEGGLQEAVVVGAGAIGIELAQSLQARGVAVSLVDTEDHVLPNLVDREMIKEAEELLVQKGIKLELHERVVALNGTQEGWVAEVVLAGGKKICFREPGKGLVVFCVGMRANTGLFKDTGLALGRNGILVNAGMETNLPGVYAVGDCAEFVSGITGKIAEGKLATNAVLMGKVAAKRILGQPAEFTGFYNGAVTKVYDLRIAGTGLTEKAAAANGYVPVAGYGQTTTRFPIIPGARKVKVKLIADRNSRRVLGGQVVGGECVAERIDLITFTIQKNLLLEDLAGLSYSAQPYQTFFPAGNAIVMAAEDALKAFSVNIANTRRQC